MSVRAVAAGVMLVLVASCAQAQIYKWFDDKGRARYGEHPPPGVSAKALAPPPAGAARAPRPDLAEQDADFKRRRIEAREAEEREARVAKVREQQCEQLRAELTYSEQLQLFRWDRGEKVYLSEAERKTHAAKVRALIAEHCR